jgi:His/Glu/Gln/Arg/opine family amino acid ABC transporter permease subunit
MIINFLINAFFTYKKTLLIGVFNTLLIWIFSGIISLSLGFFWGLARNKNIIKSFYLRNFFDFIAYIIQGIPFYIQLLIYYFIIFQSFIFTISPLIIGIISLGICSAAYTSQIITGSIDSIQSNQWKIAYSLGFSKFEVLYYIILPQAKSIILPLFLNEFDQLLKSTTILSTIGIFEFTRASLNIVSDTLNPKPVYLILALFYLFLSFLFRLIYKLYLVKNKNNIKINSEIIND